MSFEDEDDERSLPTVAPGPEAMSVELGAVDQAVQSLALVRFLVKRGDHDSARNAASRAVLLVCEALGLDEDQQEQVRGMVLDVEERHANAMLVQDQAPMYSGGRDARQAEAGA